MNPLLLPELRELIHEKDAQALRDFLGRLHPAHAADLIEGLKPEELTWVLQILPDQKEAEIFSYFNTDVQIEQASGVGRSELAQMLMHLKPDDRAEFARRLPPHVMEELLPLLASAERHDVAKLLSFEKGTAGSRMTTDYATLPVSASCAKALEIVRQQAPNKETIYSLYVVDDDRHLEGVLDLKSLLLAKPDTLVKNIMRSEYATAHADEQVSQAAELVKKYDLLALPIIDHNGRLLGIVTVDDLIDVMEREATQDFLALGAVEPGALDRPYFDNNVFYVVKKRIGWLLLLFITEMFTGTVLRHYDEFIQQVVALSFFIPLLLSSGGNAGSQTVSTIIRSLALKEIHAKNWPQVLFREAGVGLCLGVIIGIVGMARALMWQPGDYALAGTVGATLVVICAWANAVAAMVPIFAEHVGLDPTVLSAPLIATLVDATGLLIYFNVAVFFISRLTSKVTTLPQEWIANLQNLAKEAPPELSFQLNELAGLSTETPKAWKDKLFELSKTAPVEIKQRLLELSGRSNEANQNEWVVPLIALVVLGTLLFFLSRRKAPAAC